MSYLVGDDNGVLGQGAAVAFRNGAGAPVLAKVQAVEPVGIFGVDAANVTTAHKYCVFIAPPNATNTAPAALNLGGQYQVLGGSIICDTASTSGTVAIEICPAGTATGSGNNVLSTATTSIAAGGVGVAATTPGVLTLNTNVDNLIVANGARINVIFGGTLTNLVNLNVTLYLGRIS